MSNTSYELKHVKSLNVNVGGWNVTPQNRLRAVIAALDDHDANVDDLLFSVIISYDDGGTARATVSYE